MTSDIMMHRDKMLHLDGEHGDGLWAVDTVPDAEVSPVLSDHHIAAGHPLDVRAETQHGGLRGGLDVVQMELRKGEIKRGTLLSHTQVG